MRTPALLLAAALAASLSACGGDDESEARAKADREAAEAAREAQQEQARADRELASDQADAANAQARADATGTPPPAAPAPLPDSDAIALLIAFDEQEVAAAKLAQQRAQDPQVKDFAKAMEAEHAADRLEARKLEKDAGPVTDGDFLQALKDRNAADLQQLQDTPDGLAFEAAYLESRLAANAAIAALIDERLAPGARQTEVKDYLAKARAALADRATRAQATQGEL